ncbi:hypothetical protein CAOG_07143 [Capsaspora owczarzaki ATCC 30864]|uniref:hypothetical protein n=1 Tax=Capsaspora owczarzaki (strain ATCC 30864) TaxID=595528 RepID=UPI000352148E|nr:hypothetical protein CAOG_07143 [Capsaspora owczarzaki ATCC 30864]|eukprot:XP_004343867.2 hypothetical protein CAOG_07143 [Capsaspora owczarzaki ATCC 30864]
MSLAQTSVALACGWAAILGAHTVLKRCIGEPYKALLARLGISLSVGQLRIHSNALNRWFMAVGRRFARFWSAWFLLSVGFGWLGMLGSIALLTANLIQALAPRTILESDVQMLSPVIPGVNVPTNHLAYYFLALAISGFCHEAGHALAAASHSVTVEGFGAFVTVLYPGCYVSLNDDQMNAISPLRQLKIYCAGVWHNAMVALLAVIGLMSITVLVWPAFAYNTGALTVVDVMEDSPLYSSLHIGDRVRSIDRVCSLSLRGDWGRCLTERRSVPVEAKGYCIPENDLREWDTAVRPWRDGNRLWQCCTIDERGQTESTLCFQHDADVSLVAGTDGVLPPLACLPVRRSILDRNRCTSKADCTPGSVCIHVEGESEQQQLITLEVEGRAPVMFLGDPYVLAYTVHLSDYAPRMRYFSAQWPIRLEMLLRYTLSLSAALALLNMLPTYYLDGQWALYASVDFFLGRIVPQSRRLAICNAILIFSLVLFVANMLAMALL